MRTLLVLAALGWVVSRPWITLFGYVALVAAAIVSLWWLSVSIERRTISRWPNRRTIDHNYVTALEAMVGEAEAEVERLHTEIGQLRASRPASEPDPKVALYRRVGLYQNAPPWLVLAARRAYRTALHPDRHPEHRKREAERRFKEAESVFDAIAADRG